MNPHSSPTAIEDIAIAWLTERDDGFSSAREREFAQWLRADPRHAAAVARLEQTLGLLNELPEFRAELNTAFDRGAPVVPFAPMAEAPPAKKSRRRSRWLAWGGLAAAIALAGVAAWRALPRPAGDYYATTVAGYQRARLTDGSTVELNAASAVRVQFTAAERHVNLETGEAHFDVAHDTARPFIVRAGDVFVRAVGTAFNVRLGSDGAVEVIVSDGKVRVGHGEPTAATADAVPLVSAGQRLVLPRQLPTPVVEKVTPEAMRTAFAWQGRLAKFDDAPLADVIARFNARSRVQLIVSDPELGRRPIGGTFALDEAEAFVRLLETDGTIVGERRSENEILLRRAR
jgi:transmembrane sensor